MKVKRISYVKYTVGYKQDWSTAHVDIPIVDRSGFLVAIHTTDGAVGIGEVAPLMPRWGTESSADAESELSYLNYRTYPNVPERIAGFDEWIAECRIDRIRFPALSFGLQSALLHLMSQKQNVPVHKLLREEAPGLVLVNGLVNEPSASTLGGVARCVDRGFNVIKIKVGFWKLTSEWKKLFEVRKHFPDIVVRVDANEAWELKEAKAFCWSCYDLDIEYVEDPLKFVTTRRLRILQRPRYVPVALDEPVRSLERCRDAISKRLCSVIVIKPTRVGSYREIGRVAQAALRAGVDVVVTGMMESSYGLSYVAACASAFGTPGRSHGLSMTEMLADDTISVPLLAENGFMKIPDVRVLPKVLKPELARALYL
jgi:o-succinylbenzoate synthase